MLFKELNLGKCKTYLIACDKHNEAVLIDLVQENIERYLAVLAYHGLKLIYAIDTHTHADHRSACKILSELTDAKIVMHRQAPHPLVDVHVDRETIDRLFKEMADEKGLSDEQADALSKKAAKMSAFLKSPARPPGPRPRARRRLPGHGVPAPGQPGSGG